MATETAAIEESLETLLENVAKVDAALQPLLNEGGECVSLLVAPGAQLPTAFP